MKCRIRDRVHLLGLESQLFSGDQPIHMPYETWNVYYCHRSYQFRQADGHRLLPNLDARNRQRERFLEYYEQRTLANRPTVGNVDTLEFMILPGERD